jgi:SagB-type dehydrogenase family enzyme
MNELNYMLGHVIPEEYVDALDEARSLLTASNGLEKDGRFRFGDYSPAGAVPDLLGLLEHFDHRLRSADHPDPIPLEEPVHDRRPSMPAGSRSTAGTEALEDKVLELLAGSFGSHAKNESARRAYPSAGGLYPVQVVAVTPRKLFSREENVFHVRPARNILEPVATVPMERVAAAVPSLGGVSPFEADFILAYGIPALASIAKYGLRGYKFAVMETGAAMQQAALIAARVGMASRPWAYFDELQMADALGFNGRTFSIELLQLFTVTGGDEE